MTTMNAEQMLRQRTAPVRLVIFDCDGVLVDSERISNRVLAEDFSQRGWALTAEQTEALFIGNTIEAIQPRAEAAIGAPFPPDWRQHIKDRIVGVMAREAVAIPGAMEALRGLSAAGVKWRVASNSSHDEMAAKFGRLGVTDMVAGLLHSYEDVGRGKPAPDLFLAAAAAAGISPAECLVIEDSVPGATAAAAAGMDCLGYDRLTDGAALRAVGAFPFHDMADLPGLVALVGIQAAA